MSNYNSKSAAYCSLSRHLKNHNCKLTAISFHLTFIVFWGKMPCIHILDYDYVVSVHTIMMIVYSKTCIIVNNLAQSFIVHVQE